MTSSIATVALAEVVPVGMLLGISYFLLFHNAKVATAIFPDVDATPDAAPRDFSRTLVALTGVMLVVEWTPSAINTILSYLTVGGVDPSFHGRLVRPFIGAVLPIAAGIYLIMRPDRLIEFLNRPRSDGLPHDADDADELPVA